MPVHNPGVWEAYGKGNQEERARVHAVLVHYNIAENGCSTRCSSVARALSASEADGLTTVSSTLTLPSSSTTNEVLAFCLVLEGCAGSPATGEEG